MGQKCSCLNNEKDNTTFYYPPIDKVKNIAYEEDQTSSKAMNKNISMIDDQLLLIKSQDNNEPVLLQSLMTSELIMKLVKFVAIWKGYKLRQLYNNSEKKKLEDETNNNLIIVKNSYTSIILEKAELKYPSFDSEGWKFYSDDYMTKINFGFVFNNRVQVTNEFYYIGQMNIASERHGSGIMVTKNGVKFQGHWIRNQFTGYGRNIDIDGNLNEGFFESSLLNGKGVKILFDDSNTYIGTFKNGLKEEYGKEECDEYTYEGSYIQDSKEGEGKLRYKKTNDLYEGQFKNNSINGHGYYIWNNKHTYTGTFLNGKMHGKGLYKWPDGGQYYGDYINNIKEGNGKFKWPNGREFDGPFKSGNPHGIGMISNGNTIQEVEFVDGKFNKDYKRKLGENLINKALKANEQKGFYDQNRNSKVLSP